MRCCVPGRSAVSRQPLEPSETDFTTVKHLQLIMSVVKLPIGAKGVSTPLSL